VISILYVILAGLFYFSPMLVATKNDRQKVFNYILLYGWLGTGWISAWCMVIDSLLSKRETR
jgi:hypothetical protein